MMIIIIRNAGEDKDGSHDKDSDGKKFDEIQGKEDMMSVYIVL